MKKIFILTLSLISFNLINTNYASACLPEGITFETQAQIDSFQFNYPNCNVIEGDVIIGTYGNVSDITNLNGLNSLISIEGSLYIHFNDSLTSLTGINNLATIEGRLVVGANPILSSLSGLDGLTSIGEDLDLSVTGENAMHFGNPYLGSLEALGNLTYLGGDLKIYNNVSLKNLIGLEGLNHISGSCMIVENDSLISLSGLNNLSSIGGHLSIKQNYSLINISELENLNSIDGKLVIYSNYLLPSLNGIDNIDPETITSLDIWFNTSLCTCEVQSICDYLMSNGGNAKIMINGSGCNSPQEVQTACNVVAVEDVLNRMQFSITPNPVINHAIIRVNSTSNSQIQVCIIDIIGNCIKNWRFDSRQSGQQEYQLNLLDIPHGMYFCKIRIGNDITTKKIIKL